MPFEPGQSVEVNGVHLTAVALDHVVPVQGFVIRDAASSIVFATDTAPTDALWQLANALPKLKAVFLEATFPNELGWLAEVSKHLTPATFAAEVRKLTRPVPRRGDALESAVSDGNCDPVAGARYSGCGIGAFSGAVCVLKARFPFRPVCVPRSVNPRLYFAVCARMNSSTFFDTAASGAFGSGAS